MDTFGVNSLNTSLNKNCFLPFFFKLNLCIEDESFVGTFELIKNGISENSLGMSLIKKRQMAYK